MGMSLALQCQVSDLTMMLHVIDLEIQTTRKEGLRWTVTGWRQSHLNRLSSWNNLWCRNYQRHAVLVMEDASSQICRVWIWQSPDKRSRWDRNIRVLEIPRPQAVPSHRELIINFWISQKSPSPQHHLSQDLRRSPQFLQPNAETSAVWKCRGRS